MAESENTRARRTPQERAAGVDERIAKLNQAIKELESNEIAWLETAKILHIPQSN